MKTTLLAFLVAWLSVGCLGAPSDDAATTATALSADPAPAEVPFAQRTGAVWGAERAPALPLVLYAGNSLTHGYGATSPDMSYPSRTMAELGALTPWQNLGHDGETTRQMAAEAATLIDAQMNPDRPPVVVVWEGTNDVVQGATAIEAYQHLADYCRARKAVGFSVILLTTLPGYNSAYPAFNSVQGPLNDLLRANWASFADALVDVGALPEFQGGPSVVYYSADHFHLQDAGYELVAQRVGPTLHQFQGAP